MKRRRRQNLAGPELTPRQALTRAEMASERGDCTTASRFYAVAASGSQHDKKMIGPERFEEVRRAVTRCRTTLSGARARRRRS